MTEDTSNRRPRMEEPRLRAEFLKASWENNVIPIIGPIDETFSETVLWPFMKLENDGSQPIKLIIESPGGDVNGMFHLMSLIRNSRVPVIAEVTMAMSAAFCILTQCHVRIAIPGAIFMHHLSHTLAWGNQNQLQDHVDYLRYIDQVAEQMVLERTKISEERMSLERNRDWYINTADALRLGVIDQIANNNYLIDPDQYKQAMKKQRKFFAKQQADFGNR